MEYIRLGQSGLKVSRLCLGTMNMGTPQWKPWIFDEARSEADRSPWRWKPASISSTSADFYSTGVGEEVVGRILKRLARREEIVVTTKVGYDMGTYQNVAGGHSRKHIMDGIDGSLTRLWYGLRRHLHAAFLRREHAGRGEAMGALNDIVRAGKARYIERLDHVHWQFAKIMQVCERNGWHRPINMQLQLNLAYREEEREMIPYCRDQGVGVLRILPRLRARLAGQATPTRRAIRPTSSPRKCMAMMSRRLRRRWRRVAARRGGVRGANRAGVGAEARRCGEHASRRGHAGAV